MSSKKNKTQKKINKKKVFIALTICILVALIGGVSVLAYGVYKDTETFDAKKLLSSGASVMYDDQGQVLYTYGSEENGTRENITYEDLPQVLVDAVVAAEDSRICFFSIREVSFFNQLLGDCRTSTSNTSGY